MSAPGRMHLLATLALGLILAMVAAFQVAAFETQSLAIGGFAPSAPHPQPSGGFVPTGTSGSKI